MEPREQQKKSHDMKGGPSRAGVSKGNISLQNKKKRPPGERTAHSLTERRRRLKLNEEFEVLKNMVPACKGEMQKLAILQV